MITSLLTLLFNNVNREVMRSSDGYFLLEFLIRFRLLQVRLSIIFEKNVRIFRLIRLFRLLQKLQRYCSKNSYLFWSS